MESFLNIVGKKISADRRNLPEEINHTLRFRKNNNSFASLWFRTPGCRYSRAGGCTMCDYFISAPISEEKMFSYFVDAMQELPQAPTLMVIMTSGSFFDDEEVPPNVRLKIYQYLKDKLPNTIFVFETHVATVTEAVIAECLSYFPPEQIQIEIGVETSNEWIRKYCVNKQITNEQLVNAIHMLNNKNIATIANFVIGIPFLTSQEILATAVESVQWAMRSGAMKASLFPVNVKPYTLVHWLQAQGFYHQPSLWLLVDILSHIRRAFLPRVDINWYTRKIPLENPLYKTNIEGPYTCDNCYPEVEKLLNQYFLGDINRGDIVDKLNGIKCDCRNRYCEELQNTDISNLEDRVQAYYRMIDANLLGGSSDYAFNKVNLYK